MSQTTRLLKAFRKAGNRGIANYQFARLRIIRYGARIADLRAEGFNIYVERQYRKGKATGVFVYYLIEEN